VEAVGIAAEAVVVGVVVEAVVGVIVEEVVAAGPTGARLKSIP
jgi:hypothetical protein